MKQVTRIDVSVTAIPSGWAVMLAGRQVFTSKTFAPAELLWAKISKALPAFGMPTHRDNGDALQPEKRLADAAFIRSRIRRQLITTGANMRWVDQLFPGR